MKCYYCIVINYTAKCTFLEVQGTGLFHSPGEPLALQLVGGPSYLSQTSQGAQPQAGTVPHVAQRRWDEILCQGAWIITKRLSAIWVWTCPILPRHTWVWDRVLDKGCKLLANIIDTHLKVQINYSPTPGNNHPISINGVKQLFLNVCLWKAKL